MEKKPYDHAFTFKDNTAVGETFADGIHMITADAATLKLILTVSRPDPPKTATKSPTGYKTPVSRLVMPIPLLADLYNQLDQIVRGMEAQGLLTRGGGSVKPTFQ